MSASLNETLPEVNHRECPAEAHDRDPGTDYVRPYGQIYDENGFLSDRQSVDAAGLLACNDCGQPLFYCLRDEWYHHVDPQAGCFMHAPWEVPAGA